MADSMIGRLLFLLIAYPYREKLDGLKFFAASLFLSRGLDSCIVRNMLSVRLDLRSLLFRRSPD